jgi:hypothetical protein
VSWCRRCCWRCAEKIVKAFGDQLPALCEKCFVARKLQHCGLCGNTLCVERGHARLFNQGGEIIHWRFVTDGAIGFAADESQIGDVVRFARLVSALEHGLGEDVVELQLVLRARMVVRDDQVRAPVFGPGGAKSEEHGFEQRAALIAALQFFRHNIQPPHLLPEAFNQLLGTVILFQDSQVLSACGTGSNVIPMLVKGLTNQFANVRNEAANDLTSDLGKKFPEQRKLAVPFLVKLLADPDSDARATATNALQEIDPQAAAKAGIK